MKSRASRLARPVAGGTAVALLAALAVTQGATAAAAADNPLPGLRLAVPAKNVTKTDTDLAETRNEVVVVRETTAGPEVTKLRANSAADAATLVRTLDAVPGVVATENQPYSIPDSEPTSSKGKVTVEDLKGALSPAEVKGSALSIDDEPYGSSQWGLYAVRAEGAWTTTRGAGVTVAVIDSGVTATNPDLVGRTKAQLNPIPGTGDPNGHGTHVAGIIAASINGVGIAGLANQASILPVRVLDASGSGDTSTLARGIILASQRGARVINMSLGGRGNDPAVARAIAYANAVGVSVVAAAGNDALNNVPVYPAAYAGVIGVGSIDWNFDHSDFSNSGSYVDISAPGESILSTVGNSWEYKNGTSMATPFVAATAALVRAANPLLRPNQVQAVLLSMAQDDPSGNGRDDQFGYGLVRADKSATRAAVLPGGLRNPVKVAVGVARAGYGNVLAVNINPDKGAGSYVFRIQKLTANRTWATLPGFYRTEGAKETKNVALPKGGYRVVVPAAGGYGSAISRPVGLTAPTVKVALRTDKKRNKLVVNVDPDKGKGYWSFKVQKLVGRTWVTLGKTYKTKGSKETKKVNLKKGVYRVYVAPKYGYAGAVSKAAVLVK
jgi:subtilisin family serine protease